MRQDCSRWRAFDYACEDELGTSGARFVGCLGAALVVLAAAAFVVYAATSFDFDTDGWHVAAEVGFWIMVGVGAAAVFGLLSGD